MQVADRAKLKQSWPKPRSRKPIVLIGAGGIVRDAHLPAYRKAGFDVAGVFDIDAERAHSLADDWAIPRTFDTLETAVSACGTTVVYDLATPPDAVARILAKLPQNSAVLIQKPMGRDLDDARAIRQISRERDLKAAVNFQLRFSPMMLAARNTISRDLIGELLEIDIKVNIFTPWHLFPFLKGMDRVEISVHSIHYLDMIRALAGNPHGVFARTMGDPRSQDYAQTRTSAVLDYGDRLRVLMNVNHNHRGGNRFQEARFRLEGTEGCMFVKLGVLYDYPNGEPDELWICRNGEEWHAVDLVGAWFPDAFIGTMSNVQRFESGEDDHLVSGVEDAFQTMALVEACYEANRVAGTPLQLE